MQIDALKTRKITAADRDLFAVLDAAMTRFADGDILALASKIVALCPTEAPSVKVTFFPTRLMASLFTSWRCTETFRS